MSPSKVINHFTRSGWVSTFMYPWNLFETWKNFQFCSPFLSLSHAILVKFHHFRFLNSYHVHIPLCMKNSPPTPSSEWVEDLTLRIWTSAGSLPSPLCSNASPGPVGSCWYLPPASDQSPQDSLLLIETRPLYYSCSQWIRHGSPQCGHKLSLFILARPPCCHVPYSSNLWCLQKQGRKNRVKRHFWDGMNGTF